VDDYDSKENLMEWYLEGWKKYADFSGRARRQEYWSWTLINMGIIFGITFIEAMFDSELFIISTLFQLAIIIPGWAVSVRRLHDTNRSGWTLLLNIIPLIGSLIVFIYLVTDSDPGLNEYGDNPKRDIYASPASTTPPHPIPSTTKASNITDELERLSTLHERGQITDYEFQQAKNKLLDDQY